MVRLKKVHTEFLALHRVSRVATADPAGTPHAVPVCHVVDGGRLYFASGEDAKKVANLRANPQVALVADDYSEAWGSLKGVMVVGRARLVPKGPRFRRIRRLLYAKYPQYEREAALEEGESVVVEIEPRRVFAWGF